MEKNDSNKTNANHKKGVKKFPSPPKKEMLSLPILLIYAVVGF